MSPKDLKEVAKKKSLLKKRDIATQNFNWLKEDYNLGLGNTRAIYDTIKPFIEK